MLATLDLAHVRTLNASQVGQRLLRDAALRAQRTHRRTEGLGQFGIEGGRVIFLARWAYGNVSFWTGAKWIAPGLGVLAFLIYGCVIYPLGMLIRLRKGDAYIERQRARIELAEKRLELRQVKS
jgi:hypothetical protein